RRLKVPGADLDGVVYAVDYLTESTRALLDGTPARTAEGLDVVVIGGGDTGTDCVATALRQGAKSVRQFEFLPEPGRTREAVGSPWPEYPIVRKDDYGQLEATARDGADPRTWAADTREVRGEDGRVASILVQRLDWSDGSPRRIEGSEEVVPAQLVLIAMGFTGAEADTLAALEDIPHVTCGDAKTGSSLVVNAISGGVACAHEVLDGLAAR
ncbi:MAG: glutamate synthase subunit beta, partial [Olegusella sp.]|nr:glutamate synthase subunit beta [Olegusella sp.]